jgi:SpoVK/Ycf46/Vps4 family AAA+-type ATPase
MLKKKHKIQIVENLQKVIMLTRPQYLHIEEVIGGNRGNGYVERKIPFKKWLATNLVIWPWRKVHGCVDRYVDLQQHLLTRVPLVYPSNFKEIARHIDYVMSLDFDDSFCVLLYGKPGTGKSYYATLIKDYLICKHNSYSDIKEHCIDLVAKEDKKDEDRFNLSSDSDIDINIIDEIDKQISQDDKAEAKARILIDKLKKKKGFIVITTNNVELLSEAITRSGRIDMALEITGFSLEESRAYLKQFNIDKEPPSNLPSKLYKFAKEENKNRHFNFKDVDYDPAKTGKMP